MSAADSTTSTWDAKNKLNYDQLELGPSSGFTTPAEKFVPFQQKQGFEVKEKDRQKD